MRKRFVKAICFFILAMLMITCIPVNAAGNFTDVPQNASYTAALERLTSLGVISGISGQFKPDALLTREQFAKMIVVAAGLEDMAQALNGDTTFTDVPVNSWSSGYINTAVKNGYIAASLDGRFHPSDSLTFGQICTILVRALGYTNQDVIGTWPVNYVSKARSLGLADGISLANSAPVPRWAAAVMIDKLLDTDIKSNNPAAEAQTFIDTTGNYTQCLIFGNSTTLETLTGNQILTDKGLFNNPSGIVLDLGTKYSLSIRNGSIIKAASLSNSITRISVDLVTDNKVSYKDNGILQTIILPDNIVYYYKGQKEDYKNISSLLQKDSSIVINNNNSNTGYESAVIFDPIYSKPEIAVNFSPSSGKLSSITFGQNTQVIRDGDIVNVSQIENGDVVYQVNDIWGGNLYLLAVDNQVTGKIVSVLPNALSPKTIQLGSISYDFSKNIDPGKLSQSNLAVGTSVSLSLGYDGKVVDVGYFGTEDNSSFAVVLDTGYNIIAQANGTRKINYTAKLLTGDGNTADYTVASDASTYKGSLVKYSYTDTDTISLQKVSYSLNGQTDINKDEGKLGSSYVSDNLKIFNIVFNDSGAPVQAEVLKWSDMPVGTVPAGKIWYTNTTSPFGDINVILTDDIFNQRNGTGVVRAITPKPGNTYEYSILVNGSEYKYTQVLSNAAIGSVYKFNMSGLGITSLAQIPFPSVKATRIGAIDSRRIMVNSTVYFYGRDMKIYYVDANGSISIKAPYELDISKSYGQISLYMDNNSSGQKVDTIVITE